MKLSCRLMPHVVLAAAFVGVGTARAASAQARPGMTPAEEARADSGRPQYTRADVDFMSGMIHHHAQAVVMAGWAASHHARPDVIRLCERIVVAQRDEILTMQTWLKERREQVPEPDYKYPPSAMAAMPGMDMGPKMMPGMLSPKQMEELSAANGSDFDRLFLLGMIQHHLGALTMVDNLLASQGSAQDDKVFKFAADVSADQTSEIDRMRGMLESVPMTSGGN